MGGGKKRKSSKKDEGHGSARKSKSKKDEGGGSAKKRSRSGAGALHVRLPPSAPLFPNVSEGFWHEDDGGKPEPKEALLAQARKACVSCLAEEKFVFFTGLPAGTQRTHVIINIFLKATGHRRISEDPAVAEEVAQMLLETFTTDVVGCTTVAGDATLHEFAAGMLTCFLAALNKVGSYIVRRSYTTRSEVSKAASTYSFS